MPRRRVESSRGAVHGDLAAPTAGRTSITLRPLWAPPIDQTVDHDHAGHGAREAALALVTGLAANQSFATGQPVRTADVLDLRAAQLS